MNGEQAAIRAGYSVRSASANSSRLLNDVRVAAAISRGLAQRAASVGISAEAVIHEYALLATACVDNYVLDDFGQLKPAEGAPDGVMRAVKSIKRKVYHDKDGGVTYDLSFELWDKPGQLKILGKHAGAKACFDRVEHTGPDGGPIQVAEIRSIIVDPKTEDA